MKLATLERIDRVELHPNADRLEIVHVLGFNCVVPKGLYKDGDIVVYIQPDTVLPKDKEWSAEYLKYSPKRVKAVKLRDIWSEGVVAPLSKFTGILSSEVLDKTFIGDDVSEIIGVIKYEPPLPKEINAIGNMPYGIPVTDEDRFENIKNKIAFGEIVDITLKIDGQSCVSENTILITEDGEKTIKEICESKYIGKVKCFNVDTNEIEFQKIENHFIQENNNNWFEIETENGIKLTVTSNHYIYLPDLNCYRLVSELNGDENLYVEI